MPVRFFILAILAALVMALVPSVATPIAVPPPTPDDPALDPGLEPIPGAPVGDALQVSLPPRQGAPGLVCSVLFTGPNLSPGRQITGRALSVCSTTVGLVGVELEVCIQQR